MGDSKAGGDFTEKNRLSLRGSGQQQDGLCCIFTGSTEEDGQVGASLLRQSDPIVLNSETEITLSRKK